MLVFELLSEAFVWYEGRRLNIIMDRHFFLKKDQDEFNIALKKKVSHIYGERLHNVQHVNSQSNLSVNIADMCAGAVLWKQRGRQDQFYNLIKDNILVEKNISWPEIKRKDLTGNKNSLEPA